MKIRRVRRRNGLTLADLAARTAISKPYLSLIETRRVPNPPSDEKLRRLERVLGLAPDELVSQAHLQRTPCDVRAVLRKLIAGQGPRDDARKAASGGGNVQQNRTEALSSDPSSTNVGNSTLNPLLEHMARTNAEELRLRPVPVINRVSAGYPCDFTDLEYPPRVADEYVGCPGLGDPDAFAARVHGDSMNPKYRQGDIVIFSPAATFRDGCDCFVRFEDGQTTFKRVFQETGASGEPILRLQPRNKRHIPQTVASPLVSGLYRAICQYRRVDDD